MSNLRDAARQALKSLRGYRREISCTQPCDAERALEAALEQTDQEPHWLTKELMADYLDMIAEAISENSTEMLRHKAHWMRRGKV